MNGPTVRFGAKWPSITSTWMYAAPAFSTIEICSPNRVKSADRIDGAISTINSERSWRLLLRILTDRSRAETHSDAHDLASFNNRPGGRRLIANGAFRSFVIRRLIFDIHPEADLVKLLTRRFF